MHIALAMKVLNEHSDTWTKLCVGAQNVVKRLERAQKQQDESNRKARRRDKDEQDFERDRENVDR